jgi:thioredoxin 2
VAIITCPHCSTRNRVPPSGEGAPRCGHCHKPLPWIVDAGADTFDAEVAASVPVLVDLWAPWCQPCKWIAPILEELARTHAGRLKVVRVDVDRAPQLSARYEVRGIPTLLLLRDGREVDRLAGAPPKPELEAWVERHLGATAST